MQIKNIYQKFIIILLLLGNTLLYAATAQIAGGTYHTVALKSDGTLWTWGQNNYGQLGNGNTGTNINTPTQAGSATNWSSISVKGYYSTALKSDGTLWTWGRNNYGQLGNGNTGTNINTPTQVGSATNWSSVSAGSYHVTALKSDGTLWTWGRNIFGELGNGTNIDTNTPTQVGSATNWSSVAVGAFHTVALKNDGTLWTWGQNNYGQLGNGTNINTNTPTQVGSATNWSSVAAGTYYTIAIKSDGTLWTWGRNSDGQLGNGTTGGNINTPIQVGSATNWSSVSPSVSHAVAIKSDGTLWSWGRNTYGQLGNETTAVFTSTPTQVGSATNWSSVSTGFYHTTTVKSDNSVWTWGYNLYGQLGDGSNTQRNTPTDINLSLSAVATTTGATPTATPSTPTELVQAFLERLYTFVLSRTADKTGMDYWTSDLMNKGLSAYEVVVNFFHSNEYLSKEVRDGSFVYDVYDSILDRRVDPAGYNYWVRQLEDGLTREELLDAMLRSNEFKKLSENYGIKVFPE